MVAGVEAQEESTGLVTDDPLVRPDCIFSLHPDAVSGRNRGVGAGVIHLNSVLEKEPKSKPRAASNVSLHSHVSAVNFLVPEKSPSKSKNAMPGASRRQSVFLNAVTQSVLGKAAEQIGVHDSPAENESRKSSLKTDGRSGSYREGVEQDKIEGKDIRLGMVAAYLLQVLIITQQRRRTDAVAETSIRVPTRAEWYCKSFFRNLLSFFLCPLAITIKALRSPPITNKNAARIVPHDDGEIAPKSKKPSNVPAWLVNAIGYLNGENFLARLSKTLTKRVDMPNAIQDDLLEFVTENLNPDLTFKGSLGSGGELHGSTSKSKGQLSSTTLAGQVFQILDAIWRVVNPGTNFLFFMNTAQIFWRLVRVD